MRLKSKPINFINFSQYNHSGYFTIYVEHYEIKEV